MQTPESAPNLSRQTEPTRSAADSELAQVRRLNRRLWAVCFLLGVLTSGIAGYLLGSHQARSSLAQQMSVQAAVSPLPEAKRLLLEGVHCSHGSPVLDAQCEAAIEMRRFILTLIQQGENDEKIKAALLRKYGEPALAGRKW
jgi:hypothetical protein